ncbi:MAG: terminase family protein [Gammaproteobacteria bacterium]|nr:terminase family protein [Gammaproteobacteria bacterium]
MITSRDLMTDKKLLGSHFDADSWNAWRALLAGFEGLPLDDAELAIWQRLTGRESAPITAADELWLAMGRRGGKSFIAAFLAVLIACFRDHASRLSVGEVATVLVISADRKQARTVFRYVTGFLHSNPMLEALISREDKESIELNNRCVIEIGTASFRSTRGYSLAAVIADEIAFWRNEESANPDREIINALRPALATLNGKLIALSSPYSKKGELWEHFRRYYGQDHHSIIFAKASSKLMNPTLRDRVIEQAKERDLAAALAEYEAEFRNDIESFIDVEVLHRASRSEPETVPHRAGNRYFAFADPNGGGADGYALAIGHKEKSGKVIIDLVTERTRCNPANVTEEYAGILKRYGITRITGDRYAGEWVSNEFRRHGIGYIFADKNRSEIYLDCLAMLNAGQIELPPNDKIIRQFQNLERRTSRVGRDTIDHPKGLHDDLANAVAGASVVVGQKKIPLSGKDIRVRFAY